MNQSALQITLNIIAVLPPKEKLLKEVQEKGAVLVARKLRDLGQVPECYIVRTANIQRASSEIQFRYPIKDIWQFDIALPPNKVLQALVSFNSLGAHFFNYPLTSEEEKFMQSLI